MRRPGAAIVEALSSKGLAPFPVSATGKPVCSGWCQMALDEPAIALDLLHNFKHAPNLGLRTGHCCAGNIGVVDLDIKNGKNGVAAFNQLIARHGGDFPRHIGPLARTASGGWHIYLCFPDDMDIKSSQSVLGDGIDVKGWHSFVVIPPSSKRVQGKRRAYSWKRSLLHYEIPPVPAWLVPLVSREERPPPLHVELRPFRFDPSDHWAEAKLREAFEDLKARPNGRCTACWSKAAFLARLVAAGRLRESDVRQTMFNAMAANGAVAKRGAAHVQRQITRGLATGSAEEPLVKRPPAGNRGAR